MTNVREEIANAADHLARSGSETPRLDAELLLCRVMGTDRAGLVMRGDGDMSSDDRTIYLALLTRRVKHEPMAYILGYRDFRHIKLAVDPRVLIPRPETEFLVEAALGLPQGARVADVGSGSGAVALALKQERPDLDVTGIDISRGALSVARMNATRLRLEVQFREGDLLAMSDAADQDGPGPEWDAVLANLPYVKDDANLPLDISEYEPRLALYGGADGLDVVRRLTSQAAALSSVRLLALEIGDGQADQTASLLAEAGFATVSRIKDLAGIERVLVGER